MLQELLVVAHGIVVRACVGAATLLALDPGDHHALGEVEEEAELDRLRQVAVEDLALVLEEHALVALAEAGHDLALLRARPTRALRRSCAREPTPPHAGPSACRR